MMANRLFTRMTICSILLTASHCVQAQTIRWAGRSWKVTSGGMAGVAPGNPANVDFNPDGYLHLQIAKREGKWTAAELFTTDNMRFGTYQWVIQGDVFNMDQTTVLGIFIYGPTHHIGADAENEIDIDFPSGTRRVTAVMPTLQFIHPRETASRTAFPAGKTTSKSAVETLLRQGWSGGLIASCSR